MTTIRIGCSLRAFRFFLALLLLIVSASCSVSQAQFQQLAATYSRGSLSVTIPYNSPQAGSGRLSVEVLDPEDNSLGRSEQTVPIRKGNGSWQQSVTLQKPVPFEDILWQRIRYRFQPGDATLPPMDGVESISQIIRRPVVHIFGQKEYLAGSQAAIRVVVSEANSGAVQPGALRIDLLVPNQQPRQLFSGSLNRRGTAEAGLRFPAALTGSYELRFAVDTPIGSAEYTQPIQLKDKASILLTTEKPIYQPSQTIHVRALALDRAAGQAAGNRKLTFEVEDSRGNKVFRKSTETDKFGIASAEFALADEVNLGTYHVRALMGSAEIPVNTAEMAVRVERYVLPKFKVDVEFAQKNNKPKRDYRPGDHVTGTVRATYFFGKPVSDAEITIKASSMDVAAFEAASATARTDKDGAYRFDLKLPDYFASRPLSQGSAQALIEATVKDSAAHAETRGEPITITQSPLLITAVPEGGTLIPNVENEVFILTSYPDGSPVSAAITVHPPDYLDRIPLIGERPARAQELTTNAAGVAIVRINPMASLESLSIDADDHHGSHASSVVPLQARSGAEQILLHTDRAVFKTGDRIQLKVLSTRAKGAAYVDVVKDGQTILTRDLDIEDGQAELSLDAAPEIAGTLDIDAFLIGRDGRPVADHRLVFVQPADDLKIEATADADAYKPGADARVQFHVTNSHGEGVQAALGLQVVDEAVFALAEKKPGFAKVFFYLEQEAMKPRYEIHSLSMDDVVEINGDAQDLAARALFSATEMANPSTFDIEFGRTLPQDKFEGFQERYRSVFEDQVSGLAAKLSQQVSERVNERTSDSEIMKAFSVLQNGAMPRDAWNSPLRIQPSGWGGGGRQLYIVRSAGPDGRFDTADDLTVYIETRTGTLAQKPGQRGSLDLHIDHERGPVNDRANVNGVVQDASGAVIPRATIALHLLSTAEVRTGHSDVAGQFTFSALPPGRYQIDVAAPAFVSVSREFTLAAHDRAQLSATLSVGAVTQTVEVMTAAMAMPLNGRNVGFGVGEGMGAAFGAAPVAAPRAALDVLHSLTALHKESGDDAPHIRSYFPEALYINPEILTDGDGNASISIPMADSITTWRMAMLASTQSGALGSASSSLKVFQDFFVDLDFPITLTQGDRVSVPIAIYNYSGNRGEVSLKLRPADWYTLNGDTADKTISVEAGSVGGSQFTLNANRIGKFKLTLSARMADAQGANPREDIVVREIEVVPNGREQSIVFNGRLDSTAQHDIHFPSVSLPDASSVVVRVYPGPLSQIVEGMDSILRMQGGCFEQTSSSTYPNILALDYMKRTKKLTPEVHAKAEGYIANGYQRLLTFEVPGGGFSWFGQAPANKILTAYGLMEFNDMSKVSDVDERLIERTADWLARQQQPDGSWKPDTSFINEGATNRYNTDVLRITAYLAWSLANTGYHGPSTEKALHFIEIHGDTHGGFRPDPYTLAVIANFAADYGKDREFTNRAMQALLDARTEEGDQVSWNAEETSVYSTGKSAAIETTGLATQALLKWGQGSETVRKALDFISSNKQASGNWGTTQATIMALRALLLATQLSASDVHGSLEIVLNGKPVETLNLTSENNDLLHQFVFKDADSMNAAMVQLNFHGSGTLAYQIVGRYFIPWQETPAAEPLSIDIVYDRTRLAQNDIATATATIRNNLPKTTNIVMVDLGIPPGFELLSEDLQSLQDKTSNQQSGRLEKFSLTPTQAILYFNALAAKQTTTITFLLRAKYPIRAHSFESRVYEYYDPDVTATARPSQLEITE